MIGRGMLIVLVVLGELVRGGMGGLGLRGDGVGWGGSGYL